jgi:RNA polymerase sigma-70 factor (ECF subfamily)
MDTFRKFYTDNGTRLLGYLLRKSGNYHLAADLMQETFVRYLERYRNQGLSVALLFTIGRNVFYDHVRRQRESVALDESFASLADDQEQLYIIKEDMRRLLEAMRQLDDDDRDILSLVVSSGLSYREIGALSGCSEGNVKVRVHRARQKLRQLLPAESL